MRELFHDFLFSKGLFVGSGEDVQAPAVLVALAKLFGIRIVSNPGWASIDMVDIAARNLGRDVPQPFYRGFPESVLKLSLGEVVVDRLLHYLHTYGRGDFSHPGHSAFEEEVVRNCFDEDVEARDFSIVGAKEALAYLEDAVGALLASTRPLSDDRYAIVRAFVEDYGFGIGECACKDTAVRLLLDTRDLTYVRLLRIADVSRLVERLQFQEYGSKNVKKLNLHNRDRKLLTAVLDALFERGACDLRVCLEKRELWKGLLHHLHYQPKNHFAAQFLRAMRNNEERSAYSAFEKAVGEGRIEEAVDVLREEKGAGAVLRNLDYVLSRSSTPREVDYVIDNVVIDNKIMLIQLLFHFSKPTSRAPRVFKFQKYGMISVHEETSCEVARRRSHVAENVAMRVRMRVSSELERACAGTLGRVYIDEGMKCIGLPLQEGASMGGVGTLPRGSRLPIPPGKKIRAFTYWERVDDIDLSAFAIGEDGGQVEFSWRMVSDADEEGESFIVFSGDQTSGYHGGSEYFDVNLDLFKARYPDKRYLVFCDNVFSGSPFTACLCRAGYMMRDEEDSGEVFEPQTVKSSFAITCASTFAYLFAIDLTTREMVWLNVARDSSERVAGTTTMDFLWDYLEATSVMNLHDFAQMLATEVVDDPAEADVVFSDKDERLREGAERICSIDTERIIELLN